MTRFKLPLLLLWICATVLKPIQSATAADAVPTAVAPSCGPRVRRSWTALTPNEQTLYKNAIALSMKSGAYIKFVEVHTEYQSMTEAHKTCMFIYWYRLFLVAFENMLRAQGPAYACITVPYWDWVNGYNRFVNHECSSMLSCSMALQRLGGIVDGKKVGLSINGVPTAGVCHTAYPLNFFCHASNIADTSKCSGCITRGPWDTKFLPASVSYASVRNQIFASTNIADFSYAIENGAHNAIHAALDGAVGTFVSPADPIFWSHHAMVDLLHTIFHKCRVGEKMMILAQKAANPVGWTTCKRQDNTVFDALDRITMRTVLFGTKPLNSTLDPVIGKYFNGLPTQFAALMDNNDFGSSSYLYLYQGLLGEMYTNSNSYTSTCGYYQGSTSSSNTHANHKDSCPFANTNYSDANNESSNSDAIADATTDAATTDAATNYSGANDTPPDPTTVCCTASYAICNEICLHETSNTRSEGSETRASPRGYRYAIGQHTAKIADHGRSREHHLGSIGAEGGLGPWIDQIEEQEKMACLFQDECLGGVKDYSPEFKQAFNVPGQLRCKQIVDRIRCGHDSMAFGTWKEIMIKTFGCPFPITKPPAAGAHK